MTLLFLLLSLVIVYLAASLILKQNIRLVLTGNISVAILASLVVSVLFTFIHEGHPTDINCFKGWADMLYHGGLSNFYTAKDSFTDYPPGYMYILWILGWLRSFFGVAYHSYDYLFIIKMPAIIANLITGGFVYALARKKVHERFALILMLFYTLNPMVLFNASVWGQVDSIHTLTLLFALYYIIEKKYFTSLMFFVASVFIKPQAFMFTPVYLYTFFQMLWASAAPIRGYLGDRDRASHDAADFYAACKPFLRCLGQLCLYGLACLAAAFLLMLPFASRANGGLDFMPVIDQYKATLGSYNYATVNAYNLYGILGLNWYNADNLFLGLSIATWGYIGLVAIVLFSFYLLQRSQTRSNIFFTAAMLNICTFIFSIKMHERYSFPIMAFLLFAYLYRMDKRLLYAYAGATAAFLINCVDVFWVTLQNNNWDLLKDTMPVFSALTTAVFVYMTILAFKAYHREKEPEFLSLAEAAALEQAAVLPKYLTGYRKPDEQIPAYDPASGEPNENDSENEADAARPAQVRFTIQETEPPAKMARRDYLLMALVTLAYAVIALINLGSMSSPESMWKSEDHREAFIDLGQVWHVSRMQWMLGPRENIDFTVAASEDGLNWTDQETITITANTVFNWAERSPDWQARYIRIQTESDELMFMEMGFRDGDGNLIAPNGPDSRNIDGLFDEQDLIPVSPTFMNGSYFDEIYHARTAYEMVHKLKVYEWTHPPLGKFIISLGISIFGMNPFGWRFMGTLFGILMLPLMYIFAKRMFRESFWAFFVTAVFALDFMHFAQTRIATIDTYITFFVIAMYYFMYRYWRTSFYDTPFRKTLIPLCLSGICMGLGIASKWPGMYAAAGLAVLFFITLGRRYREYRYAKREGLTDIAGKFPRYAVYTLLWCVLFFIIVPLLIYLVSYIPYYSTGSLYPMRDHIWFWNSHPWMKTLLPDNGLGNYLGAVIQNQVDIFRYHAYLESTHPYSSPWFTWPIIGRPIFYYAGYISDQVKMGISSMGNPAVWLTGLVALFYAISHYARTRKSLPLFLIIGYFAQLIFWMPVARTTYIYHYFPCVPFLALLIGWMFRELTARFHRRAAYIYLIVTAVLFVMYYPVLSGAPVSVWYVEYILRIGGVLRRFWQLI